MNRRGFISMLGGIAGAPLVPWRGIIEPRIMLPSRLVIAVFATIDTAVGGTPPYQYIRIWMKGGAGPVRILRVS